MCRHWHGTAAVRAGWVLAGLAACAILASPAGAQSKAADAPWSGQVVCKLDVQSQGYTRQETQTWTMASSPARQQGAFRLFPVTWTVTGGGSVQKDQNGQSFSAQWTMNVPPATGTFAVFVRASDGMLVFRQWHAQMRTEGGVRGTKLFGATGGPMQSGYSTHAAFEWGLPWMTYDPQSPNPSGTFTINAEALPAELNGPADLPRIANCSWQFTRSGGAASAGTPGGASAGGTGTAGSAGSAGSANSGSQNAGGAAAGAAGGNNSAECQRSAADIVQSFNSMEASIAQQFDKMIQEASDPTTKQNLMAQKQRTLAGLQAQEQRDLQSTSQGCPGGGQQASGGTAGGGATTGSGSTSGGGAAAGGATSGGGTGAAGGSAGAAGTSGGTSGGGSGTAAGGSSGSGGSGSSGAGSGTGNTAGGMTIAPDPNEPNDSASSPTILGTISGGQTITRFANLHNAADVDFYQFSVTAGTQVSVTLNAAGSATNFLLKRSSTRMIALDATATLGGTTATLTVPAGQADTYLLAVSSNPWNASSPNYALTLTGIPGSGTPNTSQPGTSTPGTSLPGTNLSTPMTVSPGQINKQVATPGITPSVTPKTSTVTKSGKPTPPAGTNLQAPAPASSNYLVTITGLMCMLAASSDDAVHVGVAVRQFDRRNGQNTMSTNVDSWVYGDVNNMQGQRKQAGSRSAMGGIGNGDLIPTGFVPGIPVNLPPQANLFPLNVFQGPLTDGIDAVVISPSVWINYGDQQLFSAWHQNEQSFNNSLMLDSGVQNQISSNTLGVLYLGSSTNSPGSHVQGSIENAVTDANIGDIIQGAALGGPLGISTGLIVQAIMSAASHPGIDRPFGLVDANATTVVLPNATLVLTREMIEKRLGSNNWTMLTINFQDTSRGFTGGDRPGAYTMFLQIQRQ